MKILTKGFWTKRAAAPPQPAPAAAIPPPLPKTAPTAPVDASKLKGFAKASALLAEKMKPEHQTAARAAKEAEASKKAEALEKLHSHAIEQGKLATKGARSSYLKLHRADIDAAIKASGENSNKWLAVFLA
jgi:hypothetical protein